MIIRRCDRSDYVYLLFLFTLSYFLVLSTVASSLRRNRLSVYHGASQQEILDGLEQPPVELDRAQQSLRQPEEDASSHGGLEGISSHSALLNAIDVMQSHYFQIWLGTWPSAIDWTAAVMGTQISATLSAITVPLEHRTPNAGPLDDQESQRHENTINQYFTQIVSFYHGENAFSLRTQAYDDMLWVVLGWLESVEFIHHHSELHYGSSSSQETESGNANSSIWYAQQFIPQFAHRARIFYDIAAKGWDTTLCGGGMVWNPYLTPYKNAITNQLFITASISMYLYFPGDDNPSPFSTVVNRADDGMICNGDLDVDHPAKAHDTRYLSAAVTAYEWLKHSNMTNAHGLYIDGFHISGWRGGSNSSNGTGKCDVRDEKVYTYNQGVLLSGLRGLYDATGKREYLEDGHTLFWNIITATGWEDRENERRKEWMGLGRGGIMEDDCDASGSCSQNGQTFKGIWWLHFTKYCQPIDDAEDEDTALLHYRSCQSYKPWVEWNARAAYATRNHEGKFGTWWGKHEWRRASDDLFEPYNDEGTDYRNEGVPDDELWRLPIEDHHEVGYRDPAEQANGPTKADKNDVNQGWDPNDRGRGRTLETQSGGLAVIRALYQWERWFSKSK